MTALLVADRLSKNFPLRREGGWLPGRSRKHLLAVDDVSLAIDAGETVGLVGESGCGKSTLVRLLARLLDPTAGEIRFGGRDLALVPARRFGRAPERASIQMVFQDPTDSLNPRFTAFAAIADPIRRLRRDRWPDPTPRVHEVARLCGLPLELLSRFPHQLSGGQKARVGIARALAVEPRLLILDEPTSSLDVSVQVVILQLLDDLKQRLGLSYLFVSHDLNVVRLLCTRVLVMYAGRIVESGATADVFSAPAHPYTAALLSAIPTLAADGQRRRIVLQGEPTSPVEPDPNMCRFYGRCRKAAPACKQAMPPLASLAPGHAAACYFPEQAAQRSGAAIEAVAGGGVSHE